jgi:hypothetical protein
MKGPSGCAAKFESVALRYWRKLSVFLDPARQNLWDTVVALWVCRTQG